MDDPFLWIALAVLAGVPAYAWAVRGRGYATFGFVILAIALPGRARACTQRLVALGAARRAPLARRRLRRTACSPRGAHLAHLVRARLRRPCSAWLVSIPGMVFIAVGRAVGPLAAGAPAGARRCSGSPGWTGGARRAALARSAAGRGRRRCRWSRRSGRSRRSCASRSADSGPDDVTRMPGRALPPPAPGAARRGGRCASCRSPIRTWDRGGRSIASSA